MEHKTGMFYGRMNKGKLSSLQSEYLSAKGQHEGLKAEKDPQGQISFVSHFVWGLPELLGLERFWKILVSIRD